jgi:polysaccharide export outer membrane protein
MFKTEEFETDAEVYERLKKAETSYILRPYDKITVRIATNKGEALVDPNYQLRTELGIKSNEEGGKEDNQPSYELREDGIVKLPLVGEMKLSGFTLAQCDSILASAYQTFYKDPFVVTKVKNKRVFVLNDRQSTVIPLDNENMNLIEVLALSGGIISSSKAHNIRLIRGDLKNPYVEVIDLSTIEGMQAANLQIHNQDIIYVEPVRQVFSEVARDILPYITLITSITTIFVLLSR